ncbi:MAG: DUF4878 domain-containing protein [Myxococcota bacterium]|jgi:hypothetical protein|nr:DUF4878 domain-containing protein [Myxococcota bacterium]
MKRLLCRHPWFLFAALIVLTLLGCGRKDPWENDDPAEVLKAFLAAVELRQTALAWEFLTPSDRTTLEQLRERFIAMGGDEREAHSFLGPGHVASSSREWASVKVDEAASSEERAVVVVTLHDERSFNVELEKIESRWYVDLPLEGLDANKESRP